MDDGTENEGRSTLDPRYYRDRLEMIRRIEVAFPDVTNTVDSPWMGHPHAGIDVQTRWQLESGRTFPDGEGRATGWWAGVNYTLSVWPFVVAREHFSDSVLAVDVRLPDDPVYALPPYIERDWLAYLEMLRAVERAFGAGSLSEEALRRRGARLQSLLWDAHLESVRTGRRRFESALGGFPAAERRFARAWGETTVEFLAALNFPTDALVSGYVNDLLPGFVLHGRRVVGPANELTPSQRLLLNQLTELHDYERHRNGRLLDRLRELAPIFRDRGLYRHLYRTLRRVLTDGDVADYAGLLTAFFRGVVAEPVESRAQDD